MITQDEIRNIRLRCMEMANMSSDNMENIIPLANAMFEWIMAFDVVEELPDAPQTPSVN